MAANVLEINDNNFQQEVLQSDQPVLVDFWAPWCGPCKMLAPVIDEVADALAGKAKVGKLNTDESPSTATSYGINAIPTVLLFKDGEVVDRFMGIVPKEKLIEAVNQHL